LLASAIILFRESIEAALIITLVLTATRGLRHRGAWVGLGMLAGLAGALLVAGFAQQISAWAEGAGQELFNASILLVACLMLGWHNVWMAKHGRELSAQVNQVGKAVNEGARHMSALALVVGLAVLREGSEVVLFISGIMAGGAEQTSMLAGAAIGLAAGVLLGVLLYQGLMRIPMRHFFTTTAWLILVLAAGLASQAAAYLVQAGLLPPLKEPLWDSSALLTEHSIIGQLLASLAGYTARPSGMQAIFWVSTLLLIWSLMRTGTKRAGHPSMRVAAVLLMSGAFISIPAPASASHKIYSPFVDFGETEVELRGHYNFDGDAAEDGSGKYKLDIGHGFTPHWFTEVVFEYEVPGQGEGELEAVEWENVFQLTEQGQHAVDWGLLAEYSFALENGNADKIELGPLMQMEFGRQVWTNNVLLAREIGSDAEDGVEWEFATRLLWRISPAFEPALELYAEKDELQIGPSVLGRTHMGNGPNIFAWEAGILAGLTHDTPDLTLRILLEAEFY
jgi:high-affinity iron transporter